MVNWKQGWIEFRNQVDPPIDTHTALVQAAATLKGDIRQLHSHLNERSRRSVFEKSTELNTTAACARYLFIEPNLALMLKHLDQIITLPDPRGRDSAPITNSVEDLVFEIGSAWDAVRKAISEFKMEGGRITNLFAPKTDDIHAEVADRFLTYGKDHVANLEKAFHNAFPGINPRKSFIEKSDQAVADLELWRFKPSKKWIPNPQHLLPPRDKVIGFAKAAIPPLVGGTTLLAGVMNADCDGHNARNGNSSLMCEAQSLIKPEFDKINQLSAALPTLHFPSSFASSQEDK